MSRVPSRRRRPVARTLAVLCVLGAAAGVFLHHSSWDHPVVVTAASVALALWLLCVPALLAALRARSVLLVVLAVVLVGVGAVQYGPLVEPGRGDDDEGVPLRVLAQNLEFGRADPAEVVATARREGVDLLVTVETTPEAVDALRRAGLTDLLPHEAADPRPGAAGIAVWSRHPVAPPQRIPGFALGVVRTDMAAPTGPVTVVAAHPVAPVFDAAVSVAEADRLREYLGGLPGPAPVVVAGDFNATWDHVRFRSLRDLGYTDSVSGGGDGWVPTWPAGRRYPPLIGIDHVLARGALAVGGTRAVDVPGTDHRSVAATVRLPAPRPR